MTLPRRPITQFDVALIPCTARKNPQGLTARTLYCGGPFSLNVRHAALAAKETFIMSAKYGLLRMDAPVRFYDAYLPKLSPGDRAELLTKIRVQAEELLKGKTLISYLPAAYFSALVEAAPWAEPTCARPFKSLGSMTLYKVLSEEIKTWPKIKSS